MIQTSSGQIVSSLQFSGGELHTKIGNIEDGHSIVARIQNAADLVELILLAEILERHKVYPNVTIPYFPYARQDRVTEPLTSFSLKAICNIINSLNFDKVTIYDPHSDVVGALLDNVEIVTTKDIFKQHLDKLSKPLPNSLTIVSPDAGAAKKAFEIAQYLGVPFICGNKHRDVKTGNITGYTIDNVHTDSTLVIDDICDGGKTFIELAKHLPNTYNSLYVTHGIFSKGVDELNKSYSRIITTNTFVSSANLTNVEILNVV